MRIFRYIVLGLLLLVAIGSAMGQPPRTVRVEGGQRAGTVVDSVLLRADSLQRDSILLSRKLIDSLRTDSIQRRRATLDSLRQIRFRLTQDTMKAGNHLLLSMVPGMGQIYNRQYWKTPVFVGAMAGFTTGGVLMGQKLKWTNTLLESAIATGESTTTIMNLQTRAYSQQSATTIFYALAGVSYLYSIADATFNFRGEMSHIRKATTLSVLFPGAGFFYTRTYWRIPIYYGALAATSAIITYNNRYYQRFKTAYNISTDGDDSTVDEFGGIYSSTVLQNARDTYRRNRDFGIICTAGVYLLSIIDTYVIATLKNWDVSEDLSITIEPTIFNTNHALPSGGGVSMRVRF